MQYLTKIINKIRASENFLACEVLLRRRPKITLIVVSVIFVGVFLVFSSNNTPQAQKPAQKVEKPKMSGVVDAVDPRAVWADKLTQSINNLDQKIGEALEEQRNGINNNMEALEAKIKALQDQKKQEETLKQKVTAQQKIKVLKPKIVPHFAHLQQTSPAFEKKDPETYVVSGSFARAVLLTGVVAETGTEASSSPQPILLRLVDHGIFSKGYKTEQIKEAILIGACHGNISSERALCRLQSLSLMNMDNEIVEKPVEGWVIGEDGRPGVKGDVIDKASDVARMAMLNGILGGMASFLQNQATAGVYPISPLTGQQHALSGANAAKGAGASGVGNALQKLADYAIKRAEAMSPVIVVAAGRTVDVVFKNGFGLKNIDKIEPAVTSVSRDTYQPAQIAPYQTSNGKTREQGYNDGMKSLEGLTVEQGNF